MTEFGFVYDAELARTITKSVSVDKFDCILLDASNLNHKKIQELYQSAETKLTVGGENSGILIIFYDDTAAFVRHLWVQTKAGFGSLKFSHTLHIGGGPHKPIAGGGVNGELFSTFQRVAAVFVNAPDKLIMNPTGEKNTTIEATSHVTPLDGNPNKCINGEIFSRLFYRFHYTGWRCVFIGGFERFFLQEFIKMEPKKPSERFKFTVFIGECNLRSISTARMMCAAEEIGANFADCPSPKEISQMLKEMTNV